MKIITLLTAAAFAFQLFALNINTASVDELQTLKGIGEKTAQKIVEYRKDHPFKQKSDLMRVKGIGSSKYEKIKDEIEL